MQMDEVTIEQKINDLKKKLKQSVCRANPSTSAGQKERSKEQTTRNGRTVGSGYRMEE